MTNRAEREKPSTRQRDWLAGSIPLALWLVSLIVYSAHFLTAPPGISGDAARLGLYAADLLHERLFPFYIYHQFAPNPLVVYLQAPVFALLGFNRVALRGVTVLGATLAAPAIYLAARWLYQDEDASLARKAGLLAALELALSTIFSTFARNGIEGAWLPVLELTTVAFLWRGLRRGAWYDFVLAGLFLGVTQYVYIVARFLPIALALATAGAILANRRLLSRWRGLLFTVLTAALVALPQWLLFLRAPYTFTARTQQSAGQFVLGLADPLPILVSKLVHQALMLGWSWHNAYNPFSNAPLLTPLMAIGLAAGVGVTLFRRRDGYVFSLIIAPAMLLPDLLAYEGVWPVATRVVPAFPFVLLLAGLGGAAIWTWLAQRPRLPAWVGYAVPVLVLLAGLFRLWDQASRVIPQVNAVDGLEWRASLVEIAEAQAIARHLDTPVLVPSSEYQRAPLAFLLADLFPRRAGGLNPPLEPGEAVTVIQPVAPERPTTEGIPAGFVADEWVLLKDGAAYFLPPLPDSIGALGPQTPITASNGVVAAHVFPARWLGGTVVETPLQAQFDNGMDLVGYQTGALAPGQPLTITLYWRPRQQIPNDAEVFVQLLDRNQQAVSALHTWPLHGAYRMRAWKPGDVVPLSYALPIASDLPPGRYQVIAGLYDLTQHRPIPLATGEERQVVATLKAPLPPDTRAPEDTASAVFGNQIELSGATLAPSADGVKATLFWKALDAPAADFTSFVHVVDSAGQIVGQADAQPLQGQYPTSIWSPGETVVDEKAISVPPGTYQVYAGWYDSTTLQRLPITTGEAAAAEGRYLVGTIVVP